MGVRDDESTAAAVLAAAPDEEFDRIAALVCRVLDVPMALVALADGDRQVIPGAAGLAEPLRSDRCVPASRSFCRRVIASGAALVVRDARHEPRVEDDPAIADLGAFAYVGVPIFGAAGRVAGVLCALAREPRQFTAGELSILSDLAAACSSSLARRHREKRSLETERALTRASRKARLLLRFSEAIVHTTTQDEVLGVVQALAHSALGAAYGELAVGDRRSVRHVRVDDLAASSPQRWLTSSPAADLPGPRVMQTGRALVYADGAAALADFPRLRDAPTPRAAGARAFLPLITSGEPIGWLGLGWRAPREMDDAFRELLSSLARMTSQAMQRAALIQQRREVASTLQDALLSRLPLVPGLDLAARYHPASEADKVGGDWYDALAFPGSTTLMIGDVAGHDVAAAAEMGHLRSILRGFAVDRADSPAQLLGRLDRASLALGSGTVATALVARLGALRSANLGGDGPVGAEGDGAVLTWSSAGHYAPVVVHADGRTTQLSGRSDLLLGIDGGVVRTDWVDRVPRGSTLLLFTDGLVELRGHRVGDRIDMLRAAAGRVAREPLDVLLDSVLAAMAHRRDQDDVVVLAARPVGPGGPGGDATSSS